MLAKNFLSGLAQMDRSELTMYKLYECIEEQPIVPSQGTLNKLYKLSLTKSRPRAVCPHTLYESREAFIDHVILLLHRFEAPNDDAFGFQFKVLSTLFQNDDICVGCINLFLSKVRLSTFIRFLMNMAGKMDHLKKIPYEMDRLFSLAALFYSKLFRHPKMYKIIMNACLMNKKMYFDHMVESSIAQTHNIRFRENAFGFVCFTLNEPLLDENSMKRAIAKMKMFYLSMKYWTDYNFAYF